MLTGVSHVGCTVPDIAAAVEFYSQLFGTAPEIRRTYEEPYTSEQVGYQDTRLDIAIFRIPGSTVRLELIEYLNPTGVPVDLETKNPGTAHLCLTADDLGTEFDRLCALGAAPRSTGPVTITSGPNAGRRVAYFRDPHGFTIEVLEIRS
ncbi:VOC family protein [Nocardia brevicatena]|uniref:VOC family protein n=1 Tax=Nocardia brevicatena TaxID=37327 RepID=UPI000594EBFF|nr:VOC family protein [Nocardia brevicatena]